MLHTKFDLNVTCVYNPITIFNFRVNDVQEKLHLNIYKSTGPDLLHQRILRTLEDSLSAPLTHIFNSSAETGMKPVDCKSANVCTRNEADNDQLGNHRPMSLTSVVFKTTEKL